MAERFEGAVFATGLLSRFNLENGEMCWTSAGHYPPILIRSDVTVGALACNPTTPWGLGSLDISKHAVVATEHLEPGDSILFFTDGVIEARQPGGFEFGLERLVDLAGQHASNQIEPEETARLILRAVLDHQNGGLNDDATLVLFRWNGPGSGASKGSRDS
jgi:serine phosphatase RsbU (regulator of sigma subunit)